MKIPRRQSHVDIHCIDSAYRNFLLIARRRENLDTVDGIVAIHILKDRQNNTIFTPNSRFFCQAPTKAMHFTTGLGRICHSYKLPVLIICFFMVIPGQ